MGIRLPPFSLRLTFEQRTQLEREAGDMSLGGYIHSRLFNDKSAPQRRRRTSPIKDHEALARVLGKLGEARLSSNLNQLAKAVNTGSLPVTPETEAALMEAAAHIQEMRRMLIEALNLEIEP